MNLSELAAHLNLSVTTVSRVLAGSPEKYRISEATTKRVVEAAQKYHAAPNPLGLGLRKGQTGMIGLLVPDITNPFFAQLAREIERELRKSDKAVLLFDSREDVKIERKLLRDMISRRLDGFILAPVGVDTEELRFAVKNENLPVVLMDRLISGVDCTSVSLDNFDAGYKAAHYLIQKGHLRIGCLRGDSRTTVDADRYNGVVAAICEAGLNVDESIVAGKGYSLADGVEASRGILSNVNKPSGVITLNGQGIIALMNVLHDYGVSVPEEISIVAFDDQPWSKFSSPAITTIAQPIGKMARMAVEIIGNREKESKVFKAELIERASVAEVDVEYT